MHVYPRMVKYLGKYLGYFKILNSISPLYSSDICTCYVFMLYRVPMKHLEVANLGQGDLDELGGSTRIPLPRYLCVPELGRTHGRQYAQVGCREHRGGHP